MGDSSLDQPEKPPPLVVSLRSSSRCAACRSITPALAMTMLHHDYRTLKISASRGCLICRFLYTEVILRPERQDARSTRLKIELGGYTINVVDYALTSFPFEIFTRDHLDGIACDMPGTSPFRDTCVHPESDECWDIARGWLKSCEGDHESCQRAVSASDFLPRRLLDVSELRPRLVETSALKPGTRYTALSHCWGNFRFLSTTTSNIEMLKMGIDIFDFPRTFQDAIRVTQGLRVHYIWIDSLCIIQDSVDDWRQEAASMVDVYKNCYLNISALSAVNGSQGFLRRREKPATVQLKSNMFLRPAIQSWREVFQKSPLSQRSWTLQERLLATRVLHFGSNDMFWECLTLSVRESNTTEYRRQAQSTDWEDENFKRSLLFTEDKRPQGSTIHSSYKDMLVRWYAVVLQYTTLFITYQEDTFPEISGIAAEIHTATGCQYIAGLWLEDLHRGLLWYRDDECRPFSGYLAPSWSWAARHAPIKWLYGNPESAALVTSNSLQADIKDTEIELSDPNNQFGVISGGHLTIEAHTKSVWFKTSHGEPPFNDPYLGLMLDIFDERGFPLGTGYLDDLVDTAKPLKATAMIITDRFSSLVNDTTGQVDRITYFLLIEETERMGHYKRVGIGYTFDGLLGRTVSEGPFDDCEKQTLILV